MQKSVKIVGFLAVQAVTFFHGMHVRVQPDIDISSEMTCVGTCVGLVWVLQARNTVLMGLEEQLAL